MTSRVAIVTGGSRGIGAATVSLFSEQDVLAITAGRSVSADENHAVHLDVRSEESVRDAFKVVNERYGRIDILVNNAGIVSQSRIEDADIEDWDAILDTNLRGAFLCSREAIRCFLKQGGGDIVNVSSIAGRTHSATASEAYTCSKYGMIGLTRQLAARYAEHGIRVNCVCPSQTLTPMLEKLPEETIAVLAAANPSKRLATPREVASAICYLASPDAAYINGAIIDVNGGKS